MGKAGKVALASIKVLKRDLEEFIGNFLDDLGFDKDKFCKNGDDSPEKIHEEIEKKREKALDKVNRFFDQLKEEIKDETLGDLCRSEKKEHSIKKDDLENIALSIKELTHKVSRLQEDLNEMKSKS